MTKKIISKQSIRFLVLETNTLVPASQFLTYCGGAFHSVSKKAYAVSNSPQLKPALSFQRLVSKTRYLTVV